MSDKLLYVVFNIKLESAHSREEILEIINKLGGKIFNVNVEYNCAEYSLEVSFAPGSFRDYTDASELAKKIARAYSWDFSESFVEGGMRDSYFARVFPNGEYFHDAQGRLKYKSVKFEG